MQITWRGSQTLKHTHTHQRAKDKLTCICILKLGKSLQAVTYYCNYAQLVGVCFLQTGDFISLILLRQSAL